MHTRLLRSGLVIWLAATISLRVAGQHLLRPDDLRGTMILFGVSFPLMAWLVRRLSTGAHLPPEQFLAGAVSVALPTLLLDPFSCVFFPVLFPNMAPQVAGVFGGWLLWCCAGAVVGALVPPWRKS
jgi:glycerol uptake facilitator-like aquaporin